MQGPEKSRIWKPLSKLQTRRLQSQLRHALSRIETLHRLLEPQAIRERDRVLSALQTCDQQDLRSAINTYTQEWFDNLAWPPWIKVELAADLDRICIRLNGASCDTWSKIAQGQGV